MMAGVRCHIGHIYAGRVAYADDLVLLASTRSGMKELINIGEEFSKELYISFSTAKSKRIELTKSMDSLNATFQMQGNNIPTVE